MISSKGLTLVHQGGNPSVAGSGKSTVYTMSDGLYIDGTKLAASGGGSTYNNLTISTGPLNTNITEDNWDTSGYYNLSTNAGVGTTINGILQDSNCRVKTLTNYSNFTNNVLTITHMSTAPSSTYSRIYVSSLGSDYKLNPGETVTLTYLQPDTYWTLMSSRHPQGDWMPLNMTGLLSPLSPVSSVSANNGFYKQTIGAAGGLVEIRFNMIPVLPSAGRYKVQFNIPSFCGTTEAQSGYVVVGTCTQILSNDPDPGSQGYVVTTAFDNFLEIVGNGRTGSYPMALVQISFVRKT
jgi:hypothetical protein